MMCEGYHGEGVWEIKYEIPSGISKTGMKFSGTYRTAYVPDI